jgi:protein required for attachment to host cells
MKRACIALVDAAHARIYAYEDNDEDPRLDEVMDLANMGRQGHQQFSDASPRRSETGRTHSVSGAPVTGASRTQMGGRGTHEDHRFREREEHEAQFAKYVVTEIARYIREHAVEHVTFVAGPKMLGALREQTAPLRQPTIVIEEVPEDLGWLTSSQVHQHLASMNVIRPRRRVAPNRSGVSR